MTGSMSAGLRFGQRARVRVLLEQRRRHEVDACVGGLRREDRRDEQLERVAVGELGVRARMMPFQRVEDPARRVTRFHRVSVNEPVRCRAVAAAGCGVCASE